MPRIPPVIKPINRYLTIVPHHKKNETQSGVILPDDYAPEKDRYITATVLDVAPDCNEALQKLRAIVCENRSVVVHENMIEDIKVRDKTYHIILENYVVGILRDANEV